MMGQVGYFQLFKSRVYHNGDTGTVKGPQPNTYDVAMYGVNTFIGSLYLCALRSNTLSCLGKIIYFNIVLELQKRWLSFKETRSVNAILVTYYVEFRTQQTSTVTGLN